MTNDIPHPFEIFWDVVTESYYIFVPDGCVLVNGVAAKNDDVVNGNLALNFGDTPPEKVYCHVKQEEDGAWKFTIDNEADADGAKFNVLIATFGQSENDGQSYDIVCSALTFSNADDLVSFSAYQRDGEWTLYEPLVATPDGIIVASLPGGGFAEGTYYVHVKTKEDGSYEANVNDSEEDTLLTSQEKSVVTTKICAFKTVAGESGRGRIELDVQYHVGTVVVDGGCDAVADEVSIDSDQHGSLELFHFKDSEQDSGKGLAKRLKANPETGEITSDDNTGVMLVARKNGKVIYIPLSGDGEDPEEPETPGGEQCDHDKTGGKEGGVAPSKEREPGEPSGGVPAGGVPAGGGDRHIGDDGCNCE